VDTTTGVFLVVGALGLVILLLSMVVGELGELGGDVDGPFSVPAIAALLGGVGFGGAAATALLPPALPTGVTALLAALAGLAVAVPLCVGRGPALPGAEGHADPGDADPPPPGRGAGRRRLRRARRRVR
jgi:hypothetical protein